MKPLTIVTVDNGWGVRDFERITSKFPFCRRIIMRKGVSDFSTETSAEIVPYDDSLGVLLAADIVLFTRVGAANLSEFEAALKAGIPVICHAGFHGGKIVHEETGYLYEHESWAVGWIERLIESEDLRAFRKQESTELVVSPKQESTELVVSQKQDVAKSVVLEESVSVERSDIQVSVITPTFRRDPRIVSRCIGSVLLQTLSSWEHLVCSDGAMEPSIATLVGSVSDKRVSYQHTAIKKLGDFGNVVRSEMLGRARGEFVLFLDDDNLIVPHYLERMVSALRENPQHGFAVCRIVHFGPLREEVVGKPPQILSGIPVKMHYIDTLQVLVRREIMQKVGWDIDRGYLADGYTLENLAGNTTYIEVPEVLGFHV